MDKYDEQNIDDVFRERFDGLKDHSVDPAAQWTNLEHSLNVANTAGGAMAGTHSLWSLAASFTGLVLLASITTMDTPRLNAVSEDYASLNETQTSLPTQGNKNLQWTATNKLPTEETSPLIGADGAEMLIAQSAPGDQGFIAPSNDYLGNNNDFEIDITDQLSSAMANRDDLNLMNPLKLKYSAGGIVERAPIQSFVPEVSENSVHSVFVRAGARIGSGESNSSHNPALWKVNNIVSLGYALNISPNTKLSIEVGHLRRSGNGIERSQEVNFEPLVAVIASSYGENANELADELKDVRESLVATSVDIIHVPIQVHVNVNEKSSASVGLFADYLLRVKNQSYMVYNSEHYINTSFGLNDTRSKEGLNSMRYGLMAGYQHNVSNRIQADVRGMIPVTSIYDRSSDYSIHREPSQLVDFQLSLSYRI